MVLCIVAFLVCIAVLFKMDYLDKLKKKKPVQYVLEETDHDRSYLMWMCPNFKCRHEEFYKETDKGLKKCPVCKQRLDWSKW